MFKPDLRFSLWFMMILVLLLTSCSGPGDAIDPQTIAQTEAAMTLAPQGTVQPPALLTPIATLDSAGELRLWLSWDTHDLQALDRVIQLFMGEYPNVTLRITYVHEDELYSALRDVPPGEGPTVLLGPSQLGPRLWEAGRIQDIGDLISTDLHTNILPVAWTQAVYDGQTVGMPLALEGVLLYRNRDLVLTPAADVNELVSTSISLANQGLGIGSALDFGFNYSVSQLQACGGSIYTADDFMGFGGSTGRCWLQLVKRLSEAGRVTLNTDDDLTLFAAGESAWLIDVAENAPALIGAIGEDNLAIDNWPIYEVTQESMGGFVWTENAYIPTGITPTETATAWSFISFMLTPQVQLILAEPSGAWHIPVLDDLELESGLQIQVAESLLQGIPLPMKSTLGQCIVGLENAVRLVAQQGADPILGLYVVVADLESVFPSTTPTPEG
ncbi:MAG TPA: extracellular solute-binding protein [Anaerolineae bacterium]|nr:extracellular solute-binding protein [Anaerolineae bacterium]